MGAYEFKSQYGGSLLTMSIEQYVRKGGGDDFVVSMEDPSNRNYGTLLIELDADEYKRALEALEGHHEKVMLVGIEDAESGSPYIFVNSVERDGKRAMFPVLLNAALYKPATDESYSDHENSSYILKLGKTLDPSQECAVRIVYAPGQRIEWNDRDQQLIS